MVQLLTEDYVMLATYDRETGAFIMSAGGTYEWKDESIHLQMEFHSLDPAQATQRFSAPVQIEDGRLMLGPAVIREVAGERWQRLAAAESPLAGAWRIRARMRNGEMSPMAQTGPRKTIKLLTGTYFQWAAMNTETGEFFGCGGGTQL